MNAKSFQSCMTLWNPMDNAHQAPLSKGFSRQEYWSGLPGPPPGNLPDPGTEPASPLSLALAGRFFTTSTTWYYWKRPWCYGPQCRRVRHDLRISYLVKRFFSKITLIFTKHSQDEFVFKINLMTSLVVQCCNYRSHMLQIRPGTAKQINKNKY